MRKCAKNVGKIFQKMWKIGKMRKNFTKIVTEFKSKKTF